MLCPICDKIIGENDSRFMYPLEKPYLNVYLHRECFIKNDIDSYVKIPENLDKFVEIYDGYRKIRSTLVKK
jgi:hypothetical protein